MVGCVPTMRRLLQKCSFQLITRESTHFVENRFFSLQHLVLRINALIFQMQHAAAATSRRLQPRADAYVYVRAHISKTTRPSAAVTPPAAARRRSAATRPSHRTSSREQRVTREKRRRRCHKSRKKTIKSSMKSDITGRIGGSDAPGGAAQAKPSKLYYPVLFMLCENSFPGTKYVGS